MSISRRRTRRPLSVSEQHELRIARRTARMHPVMAAVMGGPSPEEARRTVARLGPREGGGKLEDSRRWHVPTISAVEHAIPAGYCMDSRTDAHALSSRLADKFAPSHAYHAGLYDALFEELYGKPWCTDSESETSKIATRVRIVLQRWVGK